MKKKILLLGALTLCLTTASFASDQKKTSSLTENAKVCNESDTGDDPFNSIADNNGNDFCITTENEELEKPYNKLRAFYGFEPSESFDFLSEKSRELLLLLEQMGAFDSPLEQMGYFKKTDQKEKTSPSNNTIDPFCVMQLLKKSRSEKITLSNKSKKIPPKKSETEATQKQRGSEQCEKGQPKLQWADVFGSKLNTKVKKQTVFYKNLYPPRRKKSQKQRKPRRRENR